MQTIYAPHSARGFTLIEMVISIVLLGILSMLSAHMISDSIMSSKRVHAENAGTASGRYAMERLSRELREVRFDDTTGAFLISSMGSPTHMVFVREVLGVDTTVTLDVTDQTLTLSHIAGSSSAILAESVTQFSLAYLDASLAETSSNAQIRYVRVSMTVSPPDGPSTVFNTLVALRNS